MNNEVLNGEQEFFVTGVKTYLDVDDAMTEFRRLVQHKCRTVASNRLVEINQACGGHWTVKDLSNYSEKTDDYLYIGKTFQVKGLGGLYFCLRFSRAHDIGALDAFVFLYRTRRDCANALWECSIANASVTWKGRNNIGFGRHLPEDKIPDFEEYLDDALTDFLAFINDSGGLGKYLGP